jgi:ribosomal protein L16 Arg81 hydroxylase
MIYRFRGESFTEQQCSSCNGNTRLKVFECRLHSSCTEARPLWPIVNGRYQVCATCPDRDVCTGQTKDHWINEVRKVSQKGITVPCLESLSAARFFTEFYERCVPVIFKIDPASWKANWLWSQDDYLIQQCGDREVEVQAGRNTDPEYEVKKDAHRRKMPFAEFVTHCAAGASNDAYITAVNNNRAALAPLFDDLGELPGILVDAKAGYYWHGSAGVVTPTHHDLTNNLLVMIRGRKKLWLLPPERSCDVGNWLHVYGRADLEHPDSAKFPTLDEVIIEVEIGPGDALYLPCGWWHQVRSLDTTIMMSYTNFVGRDNNFAATHPRTGQ